MNLDKNALAELSAFFNHHHDKLLCTSNKKGEPNVSLMGTPRMNENGEIEFQISDEISVTRNNIEENRSVLFMLYQPGPRARDYTGVRIYAEVTEIITSGEKLESIRAGIRSRFGEEKASELQATVTCRVTKVRPVVDRGQDWNMPPFEKEA